MVLLLLFQGDPVRDLVYRYMGEQEALKRQVLTAETVTQDFEGMKQLMVTAAQNFYISPTDNSACLCLSPQCFEM